MSAPNDGAPAFPTDLDRAARGVTPGMSLRDWFAGQALGACVEWGRLAHSEQWRDDEFYDVAPLPGSEAFDKTIDEPYEDFGTREEQESQIRAMQKLRDDTWQEIASSAYIIADAMLAARKENGGAQ
jgi:hypothetical protein